MAGTVSFGGIGSGLNTESIVSGLVTASQGPLNAMKSQLTNLGTDTTQLSSIGSLLGKLQTALEAIDEQREVGSYSATSSNSAIGVTLSGNATPGSYQISVDQLASEQRTYSDAYDSSTDALGVSGYLNLTVAGVAAPSIGINATDSLESIASRINAAGLRVSASVFTDGSQYRLVVRGLDSGAANAITFDGTTLGMDNAANTRQPAQDAKLTIDGFTTTRPTNQVVGAIGGVTLNLTATTTSPATVKVDTDPAGLTTKLNSVVTAYNAVIDAVHTAAGFGTSKAAAADLAGDPLLRSLTSRMSSAVGSLVGSGRYQTLGSLGIKLDMTGHMSLDNDALQTALQNDATSVANVIAGPTDGTGAIDVLRDVVKAFNTAGTGMLAGRQQSITEKQKDLNDRIDTEQARLDAYAESLRKQFTQLDKLMSGTNTDLTYLANFFG